MTAATLKVNIDRVTDELANLARLSDAPAPAVTRVVYTDADLAARAFINNLCRELDLAIRVDPIGNLFARWEGTRPHLPAIGTGSHIDAIPDSGRFDGTVGVLGALAAIRTLRGAGFQPVLPIELLMFTSEEPTRFGIGCLGSRVLSGSLPAAAAASLRNADGRSLDEVRRAAGFHGQLADVQLSDDYFSAFVELHIEQAKVLEEAGFSIGIVTAIAAPAALRITLKGEGGHAGTVLMPWRKDALCAAAETVLAVEKIARSSGSVDTVATTGVCRVHPGAINSIPDRVVLEIDIRDIELSRRDSVLTMIQQAVTEIARRRDLEASIECLNSDPPAYTASVVVEAIQSACSALNLKSLPLVSRAYHDSLFMARIAPTGMIFIPCKDGISHRPDEYCEPEAIARNRGAGIDAGPAGGGRDGIVRSQPGPRPSGVLSRALERSRDDTLGLVGGDEDFVGVFQAEGLEIDEDAVLVGHGECDSLDLRRCVESRRAHRVQRMLHGQALMQGKRFDQRRANRLACDVPVNFPICIEPVGFHHRGHDSVGGILERGIAIAKEAAKSRCSRLEQKQFVNARLHAQSGAGAMDDGCPQLARPARKCVRMRSAIHGNAVERLLGESDGRRFDVGMIREEVTAERRGVFLDRFERMLLGECEGDIFHRIGRDDHAVVTAGVRAGEIARELDLDR